MSSRANYTDRWMCLSAREKVKGCATGRRILGATIRKKSPILHPFLSVPFPSVGMGFLLLRGLELNSRVSVVYLSFRPRRSNLRAIETLSKVKLAVFPRSSVLRDP